MKFQRKENWSKRLLKEKHWVLQALLLVLVAIIVGTLFKSTSMTVKNLSKVSVEELKEVFFGDTPYVFYCQRGGEDTIPMAMSQLHGSLGSKISFAILNCYKKLPSGRNIYEKFRLKKDVKPTIFVTSPWAKPAQVPSNKLTSADALQDFIEDAIAAKGIPIGSSKELVANCGYSAPIKALDGFDPDLDPCIVLMKGSKFSKEHRELEEKLVRGFKSIHFVSIQASKNRLSFEDSASNLGDQFGMKLHALKGNTSYLSMAYPMNWDNAKTFITSTMAKTNDEFNEDPSGKISVVAPASNRFKKRGQSGSSSARSRKKTTPQKDASDSSKDSDNTEFKSADQLKAERKERERLRREKMEKEQEEQSIQEEDEEDEYLGNEDADEGEPMRNDEDIIEL
jgi:hypothetical protein